MEMGHKDLSQNAPACETLWQERLSGFAASHILISLFGAMAGMVCLALLEFIPFGFSALCGAVILLFLYAAAGFWLARTRQWSLPGRREGLAAFLRPAVIAWCWGGLVLVSAFVPQESGLAACLLMLSVFLASPSFLIVFLLMACGVLELGAPGYLLALFLAGGIPPLLFLLGSLFGSRKQREEDRKEEE